MFEVPNLDDISHDPADLLEACKVLRILAQYCEHRAFALQDRLLGRINVARNYERINEERYNSLPEWAKW